MFTERTPIEQIEIEEIPQKQLDNLEELVESSSVADEIVEDLKIYQCEEKGKEVNIEKVYHKLIDIENYALSNNKDILDVKKQDYKYLIAVLNETHFIKKAIGTHNKITYGVMFGVGTIFGMMSNTWLPYAHILWEMIKLSK